MCPKLVVDYKKEKCFVKKPTPTIFKKELKANE